MKERVETRLTEERYVTSDPERLLNMYTAERVLRTWVENFTDEDTGEMLSIDRNEVLFDRGILIDAKVTSELQFYLQTGDITRIEVSNQRRIAYEAENNTLYPYVATVRIADKNKKFLFYSTGLENAITILRDYLELNYTSPFVIRVIKDFATDFVLVDNLKSWGVETDNEEALPEVKKYYQIEFNIENNLRYVTSKKVIVQTFNVDRAMMLINDYIIKQEKLRVEHYKKEGLKYDRQDLTTSIESAKTISLSAFIPKEFSQVYAGAGA